MPTFFEHLVELIDSGEPCVAVTVVDVSGSVPNERGARMLVSLNGLRSGTIGGGKVEKRAIEEALRLLSGELQQTTMFVQWNLNKDIGMTCGGSMKLFFETFNVRSWNVVVFGAGHVANALVRILVTFDCHVTCIDPREEWLAKLADGGNLTKIHTDDMPAEVAKIPDGSFVVLMTMGHATDAPILVELLRQRTFPYVGVIGSRAKAVRLREELDRAGLSPLRESFRCPIGLDVGTNDPSEIAVSVSAELLAERDRMRRSRSGQVTSDK